MSGRILIIDDEETLCYFLKESLEEKGYEAETAHTAADGLEQLARRDVDLVLLDLKLPDGEGLDVLCEIRKADVSLPVIVLTGHAAVESAVRAMKLGAYDYLEKPINLAQLSSSVAEVLNSSPRKRTTTMVLDAELEAERAASQKPGAGVEAEAEAGLGIEQTAAVSRRLRQLGRRLEEASILDAISCSLLRHCTVHELVEAAMDGLLELPSVGMVAIFVGDSEDDDLVFAGQRRFPAEVWEEPQLRRLQVNGVLCQAVSRWETALPLSEAGPDPWVDELNARLGSGIATALVPLRDGSGLRGLMILGRREGRAYDGSEIQILRTVGERLALALGRACRMSSLTEHVGRLSDREVVQRRWLESIADGVVVIDGQGSVKMVNPAAERLLDCREEDALGRGMEDLLGSGAHIVKDSLERALAYSQEEIAVGESAGELTPIQMGVCPLRGDGNTVSGAIVTLTDLSRAKEHEEERSRLGRLAVLAEVSGVVAHEIRNPLSGMVAGIQHLLTKFKEGDDRYGDLQRMLKEGERVNRIIEDILMVTRPPHLNLVPTDISEVIGEVLVQCEDKAKAQRVQIREYTSPDLPLVRGDTDRLEQALLKLVLNGIEAMLDGGQLEVVVTGPRRGDAPYVEVEIRDNGVAIKKEDRERVFEPFYTTKTRGSGLGLVIAKRIIDGHGGEIWMQSEEGEGTKVIVRLPLAGRGGS